jgi:hypothetical protein
MQHVGFTQIETEQRARWFIGSGCVFADDFIKNNIGAEKLKGVDMTGSYIIHMDKPVPCTFITFGAAGTWVPNSAITKQTAVTRTEAEAVKIGQFMFAIDPNNEYGIRAHVYHIDLSAGKILRRPTDDEIARLHLSYRDQKLPQSAKNKAKGAGAGTTGAGTKKERELRALDRRRLTDAGILPPPERSTNSKKKEEISDDEDECLPTVIVEEQQEEVEEEEPSELVPGVIDDIKEVEVTECPKKRLRSEKTDESTLERVLKEMQVLSRQKLRP